jgi:hypothetical protein
VTITTQGLALPSDHPHLLISFTQWSIPPNAHHSAVISSSQWGRGPWTCLPIRATKVCQCLPVWLPVCLPTTPVFVCLWAAAELTGFQLCTWAVTSSAVITPALTQTVGTQWTPCCSLSVVSRHNVVVCQLSSDTVLLSVSCLQTPCSCLSAVSRHSVVILA